MLLKEAQELASQIVARHAQLIFKALGVSIPTIRLEFTLRGAAAGRAITSSRTYPVIQVNKDMCQREDDSFIQAVVSHEFAHIATFYAYGRVKSHGTEWKAIMRLIGQIPERTHAYQVTPAKVMQYHEYSCACTGKTHALSTIRHNRQQIKHGATKYQCKLCKAILKYTGKTIT